MNNINPLVEIIERGDALEIEAARNQVGPELLPGLAAHYRGLDDWPRKLALVNLIQDCISPNTRFIMLDILHAPEQSGDEEVILTKAIALCHLENNFQRFDAYYQDRRLLHDTVRKYIRQAPRQTLDPKKPKLTTIIAAVALVVGPLLTLLGSQTAQTLETFRQEGVSANARVIGKRRAYRRLCISTSYFDAPLLEGGTMRRSESCDVVFGSIWHALQKGDTVEILILPNEPDRFMIKSALLPENQPLLNDTRIGIMLISVALSIVAFKRISRAPVSKPASTQH